MWSLASKLTSLSPSFLISIKRTVAPPTQVSSLTIQHCELVLFWKDYLTHRRCSNMEASFIFFTPFPSIFWKDCLIFSLCQEYSSTEEILTAQFCKDFPLLISSFGIQLYGVNADCTVNFSCLSPQLNYMSKKDKNYAILLWDLLSWPTIILYF